MPPKRLGQGCVFTQVDVGYATGICIVSISRCLPSTVLYLLASGDLVAKTMGGFLVVIIRLYESHGSHQVVVGCSFLTMLAGLR